MGDGAMCHYCRRYECACRPREVPVEKKPHEQLAHEILTNCRGGAMDHSKLCEGLGMFFKHVEELVYWIQRRHVIDHTCAWDICDDRVCAAARGEPFDRDVEITPKDLGDPREVP